MGIHVNANRTLPRMVCILHGMGILVSIGGLLASCGGGSIPAQPRQLIALAMQPSVANAVAPGGTVLFSVTGTFDQAPTTQTNLTAQWASSDSSVATIDPNTGLATCVAVGGPITITASAAGKGGTLHGSGTLACMVSAGSGSGLCFLGFSGGNVMNGYCIGERNGMCRSAYDPFHCPPGQPADTPGVFQCGPGSTFNVDTSRSCAP